MEEPKPDPERDPNSPEPNDRIPPNAILIIEGVVVHMLKEAVINIGRKLENHITIDDPRISRHHAQLRAVNGHFMLVDLDSLGGTFVNGLRTKQVVLYPGDLISLAGVSLVYAQDDPALRSDQVDTAPLTASETVELNQPPDPVRDARTLDIRAGSSTAQRPVDAAVREQWAGIYPLLNKFLHALPDSQTSVVLRFEQIEELLHAQLPAAAYAERSWWEPAREGGPTAGWRLEGLDITAHWVKFSRGH